IAGLVAYFPSVLVPPDPGGNTSAIFVVDWANPAAPASACAKSPLPSVYALMPPRSLPCPFIRASRFLTTVSLSCATASPATAKVNTAASTACRVDDFITLPLASTLGRIGGPRRITVTLGKATIPSPPHHYVIGISMWVLKPGRSRIRWYQDCRFFRRGRS